MRDLLCLALGLFQLAILARIILSWFPLDPNGVMAKVSGGLRSITDPVLEPVRRMLPRTGFIDLSPLLVLIAISLVQSLVLRCGPGFF